MKQFKEYLNKKSDEIGQELMIYASGSGALSFVWQYRSGPDKGNASGEKVTELDAKALFATKDDGHYILKYQLVELFGQYHILQPVIAHSDGIRYMIGKSTFIKTNDNKLFVIKDNEHFETKNISVKSSIEFHCENSTQWKQVSILQELENLK